MLSPLAIPGGGRVISDGIKAPEAEIKPFPALQIQAPAELPTLKPVYVPPKVQTPVIRIGNAPYGFGNSYEAGQCTWGVANWKRIPMGMSDANQWDDWARAWGWTVSSVPRVGSVAQSDAGTWGHVALVTGVSGNQVKIKEMNWNGPYSVREAWWPVGSYEYIYF